MDLISIIKAVGPTLEEIRIDEICCSSPEDLAAWFVTIKITASTSTRFSALIVFVLSIKLLKNAYVRRSPMLLMYKVTQFQRSLPKRLMVDCGCITPFTFSVDCAGSTTP